MTLDEAIAHSLEVAECNEIAGLESEARRQCYDDHRQLAVWLQELRARRHYMEKICEVLAEQFGSPCNFSPIDEYMLENGGCDDCCGEIPDAECWSRYLQTKLIGGSENG